MFVAKITFGSVADSKLDQYETEELATNYLGCTSKNGQIYGDYYPFWHNGTLTCHINLARPNSMELRFHSKWGKTERQKVIEVFGEHPTIEILEDDVPKRFRNWKKSSSLYLTTSFLGEVSPLTCGDTGDSIPLYLIPIDDETRDGLHFWEASYQAADRLFIASGALETIAYKQLADPHCEISKNGSEICADIERATGIPTYFYLQRYWGRKEGETKRPCPGCGGKWHTKSAAGPDRNPFHEFDFRCKKCRLVSHRACDTSDERFARLGKFKPLK